MQDLKDGINLFLTHRWAWTFGWVVGNLLINNPAVVK